jgi:hypothetical protein
MKPLDRRPEERKQDIMVQAQIKTTGTSQSCPQCENICENCKVGVTQISALFKTLPNQ